MLIASPDPFIDTVLSSPHTVALPIIRRSGGLPIVWNAIATALLQTDPMKLPVFIDRFIADFLHETDALRRTHDLNILKQLLASPDFAPFFHSHFCAILCACLHCLDSREFRSVFPLISSWNVRSAAAQVVATLAQRIFRARRSSGDGELVNRIADLAVQFEFPALFPALEEMLQNTAGTNAAFAVGFAPWRNARFCSFSDASFPAGIAGVGGKVWFPASFTRGISCDRPRVAPSPRECEWIRFAGNWGICAMRCVPAGRRGDWREKSGRFRETIR